MLFFNMHMYHAHPHIGMFCNQILMNVEFVCGRFQNEILAL